MFVFVFNQISSILLELERLLCHLEASSQCQCLEVLCFAGPKCFPSFFEQFRDPHYGLCVLFEQFGLSTCVLGKPRPLIKYLLTLKEGNRRVDPQTGETALVPFQLLCGAEDKFYFI